MSEETYIDYVVKQIENLKESSKLIEDGYIIPMRINKALAEYQEVNLSLIAEYQRAKTADKIIQREYTEWADGKFLEARDKLNEDRTKSKYASKSEIESQMRFDNKEEYKEWQEKLDLSESKVKFLLRVLDSWKKSDNTLIQLSKNMQSEMYALSVDEFTPQKRGRKRVGG